MRICFAGSSFRIQPLRKLIESFYDDIDASYLEDSRDYYSEEFTERLQEMKDKVDAVIFTGEFHYDFYNKIFFPGIPCEYIKKDWSTLQNALLDITLKGVDFSNTSIDSYSSSMVKHLTADLNIDIDNIQLIKRGKFKKKYSDDLFIQHKNMYRSGIVKGCITSIHTTYSMLINEAIPCSYAKPTSDVIIKTINATRRQYFEKVGKTGNLAILIIQILPKKEYSYIRKDEYLYMHEKMKVAEEIYFFARDTNAAIVSESTDKFIILMNRMDFVKYTDGLQNFYLLNSVFNNTNCDVSVGIGYGFNPGEAKFNANLAIERSDIQERNATYIVSNSDSTIGPLKFVDLKSKNGEKDIEDKQFKELAEKSGISPLKFYTLYSLIEKKKKNTFTAVELSTKMDLSVRSVNRMLKKLEDSGLARIVSKKTTGGKGRPRDVYELNLSPMEADRNNT